jgi:hypothetical protein
LSREVAIRAALRPLAIAAAGRPGTRVIDEFWTPASHERADLATVGDDLHGYEIKSAQDTLRRLPRQVAAFGRIFDRCTAVIAARHEMRADGLLPEWWGLVIVEPGPEPIFLTRREGQANPSVDVELVVRLLWRAEVTQILLDHGVQPDLPGGRSAMWTQLLEALDPSKITAVVRDALRSREHWRGQGGQPRLSSLLSSAR